MIFFLVVTEYKPGAAPQGPKETLPLIEFTVASGTLHAHTFAKSYKTLRNAMNLIHRKWSVCVKEFSLVWRNSREGWNLEGLQVQEGNLKTERRGEGRREEEERGGGWLSRRSKALSRKNKAIGGEEVQLHQNGKPKLGNNR